MFLLKLSHSTKMCNGEKRSSYMHVMQRRFSSRIMHGFENYSDLQKYRSPKVKFKNLTLGDRYFFMLKLLGDFFVDDMHANVLIIITETVAK